MKKETPVLQIQNLGHSYGKFEVIKDVSMDIYQSELACLIGPNGAGKTTFYNAISGKFKPKKGKVLLNGNIINGLKPHNIAKKGLCRSFQITNVFNDLTVLENILVPLILKNNYGFKLFGNIFNNKKILNKAYLILEQVGLVKFLNEKVSRLAYGDKRLVEIAITIARDPVVILLDEPTAGMNPEETEKMINLIKSLSETLGSTFLVTEHDMKVVFSLADKIYVLHQGHLLAEGKPSDIRNNEKVQEAYLGRKSNA